MVRCALKPINDPKIMLKLTLTGSNMNLVILHNRLSITILLYLIILFIWGIWRYLRHEGVSGNYWGALVISEILILIQGLFGLILYISGLKPESGGIHILYGIIGALGIPAVYIFTKGRNEPMVILIYSIVLFFEFCNIYSIDCYWLIKPLRILTRSPIEG